MKDLSSDWLGTIKRFFLSLWKDYTELVWEQKSILLLFILRSFYLLVPDISIPFYKPTHPEYTYQVAYHFFCTALIELCVCFIIHRVTKKHLSFIFFLWACGKVFDQINGTALHWNIREGVWMTIAIIWTFIVWYKKENSETS